MKTKQFAIFAMAILVTAIYLMSPSETRLPNDRLGVMVDEHPQLASSLASGNRPLLADTDKALADAERALTEAPAGDAISTEGSKLIQPSAPTSAWGEAGADVAPPSIPLAVGVSVYQQVQVDMERPVFPSPGEQVTLAMPGGKTIVVNVETSSANPNGDYTWRGHLEGYGTDYPVVMTYGGAGVFASMTTPEGSYTMESINGSGWVYKNPSEFELSHPGTNDYLETPLMSSGNE